MEVTALARSLLRPRRRRLVTVLALHGGATVTALLGPPLIGAAVDRLNTGATVVGPLGAFVAATIAAAALTGAASRAAAVLTEDVLADVRRRVVETIAGIPLAELEQRSTGDLLTRATADVEAVSVALRSGVWRLLVALLTVTATAAALVALAPMLAAAALGGVVVAAPPLRWYSRRCRPVYEGEREANAARVRAFHGGVTTAPLLRAYGLERRRLAAQAAVDRRWFDAAMQGARLRVVARAGVSIGIATALGAVVVAGAMDVDAGTTTVGSVTAAVLYLLRLVEPLELVVHELDELQTARAAAARVADVVVEPMTTDAAGGATPGDASVVGSGLTFAYESGEEVLHGVDIGIAPGERVALIGPSGAGKSTLARILAGVHAPTSGSVLLGGVDAQDIDPADLRRWVLILEQEGRVFTGSVADNLRLVAPEATDAELRDALAAVGAAWPAALPDGLETEIGSGGRALDPVQARQLGLARLVLTDPPVLVVDEATAGFDAGAAGAADHAMERVLHGRTVISISHRLDAAARADRVLVVEDGGIVESGHHADLLTRDGAYAALWQAWAPTP